MTWDYKFHPGAAKDLYKLSKRNKPLGQEIVRIHIPKILDHPYRAGIKKHGSLFNVWGYNFTFSGQSYRILYTIHKNFVRFIAFGVHDITYRRAEGRI